MKTLFTFAKRTGSSSPAGPAYPPCWIILSVRGAETWRRIGRGGNRANTGSCWPLTYLWGKDRWLLQWWQLVLSCSVFVCDFFIIFSAKSAPRARFRTIRANPSLFCLTHHFSPFCPSLPPFPPNFALSGAFSCGSPKTRLEEGTPVPTIPPVARIILSNCRGPPPLCTYNHLLFITVLKMLMMTKICITPGQKYNDLSMNLYDWRWSVWVRTLKKWNTCSYFQRNHNFPFSPLLTSNGK